MAKKWRLGDECFIVVKNLNTDKPYMRVMPATVTHIGGVDSKLVVATANSNFIAGNLFEESNTPFETETEATEHIYNFVMKVADCLSETAIVGSRPILNIDPEEVPANGDLIYVVDEQAQEILEARVGIVRWHYGVVEIGYDPDPTQSEVSIVRAKRWFNTRPEAEQFVQTKYGKTFKFLNEQELKHDTSKTLA